MSCLKDICSNEAKIQETSQVRGWQINYLKAQNLMLHSIYQ